jgi:hypothetical protein
MKTKTHFPLKKHYKKQLCFVCLFIFLTNGSASVFLMSPGAQNRHVSRSQLCRDLVKIHRIPFYDEPVNDAVYNKIAQAGPSIIPCLVNRITDTTKMRDPRSEPTFSDFRVGDLAFFLLVQLKKVPFETMLPSEVQARLKTEGVYAYFRYVSRFKNRQILQKRVREWLWHNSLSPAG